MEAHSRDFHVSANRRDPVIDDQHPVRVLVVDPSGGADLVTGATSTVGEYFQITACDSLTQASDHLRIQPYDLIVLEPNLPDSWPADSYRRLSEFVLLPI